MPFRRLANSTVVWSWILTALRLAKGLVILPLVMHLFSPSELGFYLVLLNLAGLAMTIDFGFGPTISRFVSYAMAGATDLSPKGIPEPAASQEPNYPLLWRLVATTRKLYRYLTLALFLIFGIGGTIYVEYLIQKEQTLHPEFSLLMPRLAWALTLISTMLDIYSNWWTLYLRGLNQVRTAAKISTAAMVVNLVVAAALLVAGAGLLSLPVAVLLSNVIQRHFARVCCLKLLPAQPKEDYYDLKATFALLWPNSWRLGVQLLSGSLASMLNLFICANVFHLDAASIYGPSVLLMGIASSMAYVWVMTKWPLISQYRARHDYEMIQRVFWPRVWLQIGTYFVLATCVVLFAGDVLHLIGKDKELLPTRWMIVLMVSVFFDSQFTSWGTLIATENRFPYLWPAVATNILSVALSVALVRFTSLGFGALVLGPLLAGCVFNYWYWPPVAARGMKTTLFRFLFLGPAKVPSPR